MKTPTPIVVEAIPLSKPSTHQQHNLLLEFDQQTSIASALSQADRQLSHARTHLPKVVEKLHKVKHERESFDLKLHKYEKRIRNNENGEGIHFLSRFTLAQPQTWFTGGVRAKVMKLKGKLQVASKRHMTLRNSESGLEDEQRDLANKLPSLENAAQKKQLACDRAVEIFVNQVQAHSSARMAQLEQLAQQWLSAVQYERKNSHLLERVLVDIRAARLAYAEAGSLLRNAFGLNQSAQFTNLINPYGGFGYGYGYGYGGGLELYETLQEQQRNALIHQASTQARKGGAALLSAFSHIPDAARQRYPQLCAGLGEVHVPDIEEVGLGEQLGNLFGGFAVDYIVNQQVMQKIQVSLQRLGEVEAIAQHQESLVDALLAAIRRDGSAAATQLRTVDEQLWNEKVHIFNQLRVANGLPQSSPEAFAVAFDHGKKISYCAHVGI